MQKIEIIGNIGRDADVKTMQDGKQFATFSVACNEKTKNGETSTWYDVTTNSVALAEWLKKGTKVFVRGRLSVRQYQTQQGENRISMNVAASEIEITNFADKKDQNSEKTDDLPEEF